MEHHEPHSTARLWTSEKRKVTGSTPVPTTRHRPTSERVSALTWCASGARFSRRVQHPCNIGTADSCSGRPATRLETAGRQSYMRPCDTDCVRHVGFAMAVIVAMAWLAVIIAAQSWGQLLLWALAVPIALAAWSARPGPDRKP